MRRIPSELSILGLPESKEVFQLKKETIQASTPTLELALKFIKEASKLKIYDYERVLFLENPKFFKINKIHKFSKITPYSLLRDCDQNPTSSIVINFSVSSDLYLYFKNEGYSDKTILRVNPNYIIEIVNPSIEVLLFYLKRISIEKSAKYHNFGIDCIEQKTESLFCLYSISDDRKLLENKLKIMRVIG